MSNDVYVEEDTFELIEMWRAELCAAYGVSPLWPDDLALSVIPPAERAAKIAHYRARYGDALVTVPV